MVEMPMLMAAIMVLKREISAACTEAVCLQGFEFHLEFPMIRQSQNESTTTANPRK
jgi:hypothetical protein